MKLNNKGFAITSVLYGLLILFVVMTSSYLMVLSAKKNKLDIITKEVEDSYYFDTEENNSFSEFPYTVPYTGKYVFSDKCYTYLYKDTVINSEQDIKFNSTDCTLNRNANVTIYYHKGE